MSMKNNIAKIWYLAKQGYSEIGFGISLITYALLLYSITFLNSLGVYGFVAIALVFVGIQPIVGYIFYKYKVMSEMHRINTTTSPYIDEIVGKKERWSYDATITQLNIQKLMLENQIQINKKLGVTSNNLEYIKDYELERIIMGYEQFLVPAYSIIKENEAEKSISFNYKNKNYKLFYNSFAQKRSLVHLIGEQFMGENYKWLEPKGRDVVDVGACMGDSILWFFANNARRIIAFEPYHQNYNCAKRVILENSIKNVKLERKGVGTSRIIKIPENVDSTSYTELLPSKEGAVTQIIDLDRIIREYKIRDNAVLKMDCENCEYESILTAKRSTLRKFKRMMFEYHKGYLPIKKKLEEAGFKVDGNKRLSWNDPNTPSPDVLGFLYAERID